MLIDEVLRKEGRFTGAVRSVPWTRVLVLVCAGGALEGVALGYNGGRPQQALISGVKVPLLIAVSTAVCLPSFHVLNLVLGLGADSREAVRGVLATQGAMAICLAALAPLTVFISLSTGDYLTAVVLNGLLFAAAACGAQGVLGRHYRPLERRSRRHCWVRRTWLALYVLVAIQSAWVLRPFVGSPDMSVAFVREDAWTNAYVQLVRIVWRWLH